MFHSEEKPEYVCAEDGSWCEVGAPCKEWTVEELTEALDVAKVRLQIAYNKIAIFEMASQAVKKSATD